MRVDRGQVHIQENGVGEETERNNIRKTRLSTGNGKAGERMKRQILGIPHRGGVV
jgi:hypothetical protein